MITTIINNSIADQWTHNYVENFNNQFNLKNNIKLNNSKLSTKNNLLEQIYYISPYIYDLFQDNHISLNTAKLKATNLYKTFSKSQKIIVSNRIHQLNKLNNFDMSKLNSINPVF
jgi:hypothetical protein